LEEKLQVDSGVFYLKRYPVTSDKSLRAWSNAELLAYDYITNKRNTTVYLYNDRFGVWNCLLNKEKVVTVYTYASQKKAILKNLEENNFSTDIKFNTALDTLSNVSLVLLKIPKSLELFHLFLQQIYNGATADVEVVCTFMVKYFSDSFLKIANIYFEEVIQTKAWKKARLLILKKPNKDILVEELMNSFEFKEKEFKQYYGVFSAKGVDIGTRFFLEHLYVGEKETNVLDLASGNGIIANEVLKLQKEARVTLLDDFNLAIASSRLNLDENRADFVCANNLSSFKTEEFDLVVSNPPFHFEHENNIEVALSLFKDVERCLKLNGRFMLVANVHLNYKTHLLKLFKSVKIVVTNKKFVVYNCLK